jgi:uncharacterized protein (DUF1697 family)
MNPYIVLLRGINVGGKNVVPMKDLKKLLEDNGFESVKTYIQSGNLILSSAESPEASVCQLIERTFGFRPAVLALTPQAFQSALSNNPFADHEGKTVHLFFCQSKPQPDTNKIEQLVSPSERHQLIDRVFYLHAPDGIARSKLVANMDRCMGVPVTGRNLNTVNKLADMAGMGC